MRGVVAVLTLLILPVPGAAQLPVHGPSPSVLFRYGQVGAGRSEVISAPGDTLLREIRPTYWKEGALIGGLVGAVGGALIGNGLCDLSEDSSRHCTGSLVVGGVLGAALLAIPGALIGGQFRKDTEEPATP
jgi:hypothetical protein